MALCFYPRGDKRAKSGKHDEDGKGQKFSSILNVKTDRLGRSVRKEQIHHVGTETKGKQHGLGRSKSVADSSPLRPLASLVDHIQSLSQRFPSRRASEITEEFAADLDGRAPASLDRNRSKRFQAGSFRKPRLPRRSPDDLSPATDAAAAAAAAAPDDKLQQPVLKSRSRGPSYRLSHVDEKNLTFVLADNKLEIIEIEGLEQQGVPTSPHPNHIDTRIDIHKTDTDRKDHSEILAWQEEASKFPGFFENPLSTPKSDILIETESISQDTSGPLNHGPEDSGASIAEGERGGDDRKMLSEPKSEWEIVLERTLSQMNESRHLSQEEEEKQQAEKVDHDIVELTPSSEPNADWQSPSPPVDRKRTWPTERQEEDAEVGKTDKRDLQWATISQRVALWLGRSRPAGHSKTPAEAKKEEKPDSKHSPEGEEIAELAPNSAPFAVSETNPKPTPVDKSATTDAEPIEDYHDNDVNENGVIELHSDPNSPPVREFETKSADASHNGISPTASGRFDDDHGVADPDSMPNSQPEIPPETTPRFSSVSDNEAVARLWEQLDMVDGEEKPEIGQDQALAGDKKSAARGKKSNAAAAAAAATTRARRRVRFSTCGGSDDFSVVDISATLLGKLSATKHHQVRYLQDELDRTRAQMAQLEQDFQAQRDLKLAFKVQAVRLGAALKKLRKFALRNGLDPRGVEGNFSLAMPTAQAEVSRDSNGDNKTKDIESSPELIILRTQAEQFGWLCDPKEVELREQIASGSTADIYKGVWHNLDVAVKCLRPDLFGENEDVTSGFCEEVKLLSRQRHPYILHMYAACLSPPDRAWIVTEYLSSGTLTEWLHGTKTRERNRIMPLPPLSERLRISIEISMAMQSLHELSPKILHRDLKPSNILLDENNHVRIADFNCARYFNAEDAILTGETGTYIYMAPEVMAHESYNEKCDIYSFAVILCELVTGTPPYIDTSYSPAEIACKVAEGALRPTLLVNQPEMLVDLIKDAWEQEPKKRPSFSGITATLKVIVAELLDFQEPSMEEPEDTH